MTAFRIAGFSGLVPRLAKQLLAPNQAQVATNCILTSGDLRPRNGPRLVEAPAIEGEIVSMFRMEKDGNEKWLAWTKDVDVARSPVAGNAERRFYYTGDGEPRVSDFDLATAGPGPYPSGCFVLGVSPPVTAPTVAPSGGTGSDTTRIYVYTFVTPWGEESKPSPPATVTGKESGATWQLSNLAAPPPNSGTVTGVLRDSPSPGYVKVTLDTVYGVRAGETLIFTGIGGMTALNGAFHLENVDAAAKTVTVLLSTAQTYTSGGTWKRDAPHNTTGMNRRIYRTVPNTAGEDEYHYVTTLPVATTAYTDTASNEDVAPNELLASQKWEMPPAGLRGIIILPNGIACGFVGNEVCFSEAFEPYAWPNAYRQPFDQQIVAIGVSGTTLVAMTKGNPFTITGVDPATMGGGMDKMGVAWPCMAKRGAAGFAFGVAYPAPQGLVMIGLNTDIVTRDLFTQKEWLDLNPSSFMAASADNRYYAGYTADDSSLMFVIDKAESASFIRINQKISAIWADPATGRLYVAIDRTIYEWEGDPGMKLSYEWKSKQFVMAPPLNFGAARIDADFSMTEAEMSAAIAAHDAAIAANQALIDSGAMNDGLADSMLGEYEIGGDAMNFIPPLVIDALQFQLWANGEFKYARQVTNTRAFRLPAGYKADNVEVVLSGNVKVSGVVLAETMDGLKGA